MCKAKYQESVPNPCNKTEKIDIFGITKPEGNFIIIESSLQDSTQSKKSLHVIQFDDELNSQIGIGRGTENDICVHDISVSRCHAFIKREADGSITIQDNNSKFGTLIQIKKPVHLSPTQTYYFQAGRTIMKANVERESKSWFNFLAPLEQDIETQLKIKMLDPNSSINATLTGDPSRDLIG